MSQPTIQEIICAALRARGWRETDRSSKYRVFVQNGARDKAFVGSNGALRVGANRSSTHSLTDTATYRMMLQEGERLLKVDTGAVQASMAAFRAKHGDASLQEPGDSIATLAPEPRANEPDTVASSPDEVGSTNV